MGILEDRLLEVVHMGDEDKSGGHSASGRTYRPGFRWLWAIPAFAGVGVVGTLIYVSQVPSGVRWSVFGTALAIAAAAFLTGGIVGFLFGIPQTVQESTPSAGNAQHQGNTNLEQVSDWLTKIIVGVGLVEIGRSLPALSKLAESMKAPLGGLASSAAFGLGLTISYALLGFFLFYLWSRLGFLQELGLVGNIQRQVDASESARSTALILVNRQLNSLRGGAAPTQDDLNKAIAAAPDSARFDIFIAAEDVRSANWSEPNTKPLMELSIPVFRGLIAADKDKKHHRHYGSLGWALKDQGRACGAPALRPDGPDRAHQPEVIQGMLDRHTVRHHRPKRMSGGQPRTVGRRPAAPCRAEALRARRRTPVSWPAPAGRWLRP